MTQPEFRDATAHWEFEQKYGCGKGASTHSWTPVGVEFTRSYAGPGRCTVVCLKCGACTYIETYWPGYKLAGALDDWRESATEEGASDE